MSYVYFVQMNIPAEKEAEFNRLYDEEHVPALSKMPGVHKITRYQLEKTNDPDMPKYLTIYEVDSPEVVENDAWRKASDGREWAPKIRPHMTERYHSFFRKI